MHRVLDVVVLTGALEGLFPFAGCLGNCIFDVRSKPSPEEGRDVEDCLCKPLNAYKNLEDVSAYRKVEEPIDPERTIRRA